MPLPLYELCIKG
ncbi:Protein of unknown function [Bacillus mycoides]|nr:Protein of unknown function [Bacillus mycoides]